VEGQSNSGTTQHGHASFSGPIWKETESIETKQNSSTDNEGDRTNEFFRGGIVTSLKTRGHWITSPYPSV